MYRGMYVCLHVDIHTHECKHRSSRASRAYIFEYIHICIYMRSHKKINAYKYILTNIYTYLLTCGEDIASAVLASDDVEGARVALNVLYVYIYIYTYICVYLE